MKQFFVLCLLLCLLLAGCALTPPEEAPLPSNTLPVPEPPGADPLSFPEVYRRPAGLEEDVPVLVNPRRNSSSSSDELPRTESSDFLPVSELPETAVPHVLGPAGTLRARTFFGFEGCDPAYGDLDGDGRTELVYWCTGPTSGLFTVEICVYGLEQGWPVLEGSSIFWVSRFSFVSLEADAGRVFFCCSSWVRDDAQDDAAAGQTLRLPVSLFQGSVLLNGGDLPEGLEVWGGGAFEGCGSSFSALREQVGDEALLDLPRCLVWQRTVPLVLGDDSEGMDIVQTCAAVTDNGVTVTGYLTLGQGENRVGCTSQEGLTPIPPVADPEALAALTAEEREARLGPCHSWWSIGSGISHLYEFWFTEDGKLLTIITTFPDGSSPTVGLWDMTAGEKHFPFIMPYDGDEDSSDPDDPSADDPDVVTVHLDAIPTQIENEERWARFLETTGRGEADAVTLRVVFSPDSFDLPLSYDGERYTLIDEGTVMRCKYLLADEEDAPRPGAKYHRAVHYLLSDDPDASWEEYFSRMVSSSAPIGVEETPIRSLFSVYE